MNFTVGLLSVSIALIVSLLLKRKKLPLPPGPKGLPLLGNIYDVPKNHEWLAFKQWGRDFASDIVYFNLVGTSVVVLNSLQAASDLFEHRSTLYSDRPRMVMLNELVGFDYHFAFMKYGEQWREYRRVFHQHFNASASRRHQPKSAEGARELLRRLLESPDEFMEHLRHMAGSVIVDIVYGIRVKGPDDPYIVEAERAMYAMAMTANAGACLVDYIPLLKYVPAWLPGAHFRRQAAEWRKSVRGMVDAPADTVKRDMARGVAPASVIASQLKDIQEGEVDAQKERLYRDTVSTLGTFMLAMLLYPDVQRKAQEELDRVVGIDRLPEFSDEASLPYITAIVKELLRWQPVTPLAVVHCLSAEDEYNGYRIPAGSLVVGNAWAMLHDDKMFPEPEVFKPERFLMDDGQLNPALKDAELPAFGFGRRICPGRHLAVSSVWISVARGRECREPNGEYTSGLISHPVPFKCSIQPRSAVAEALIRSSCLERE
ncbi:cytochrome P450 [Amylocystis lapponica]|nr:cytochrome P450 [Amylocystis lapponica]